MQHGFHGGPMCFRGDTHQVCCIVGAATLPGGPWQAQSHRVNKSRTGVTGDKSHPAETSGDKLSKKHVPTSGRFRCSRLYASHFPRFDNARPSALTPVAIMTTVFTTVPPSRTFIAYASAATNVNGPTSSKGRCRNLGDLFIKLLTHSRYLRL